MFDILVRTCINGAIHRAKMLNRILRKNVFAAHVTAESFASNFPSSVIYNIIEFSISEAMPLTQATPTALVRIECPHKTNMLRLMTLFFTMLLFNLRLSLTPFGSDPTKRHTSAGDIKFASSRDYFYEKISIFVAIQFASLRLLLERLHDDRFHLNAR